MHNANERWSLFYQTCGISLQLAILLDYFRKNPDWRDGEDMEFPGALEKQHEEVPGIK